jgi:hypothetical protein
VHGHTQFQTTQKYQHTLPDTDQKNLDTFSRVADRRIQVIPAQNDVVFRWRECSQDLPRLWVAG